MPTPNDMQPLTIRLPATQIAAVNSVMRLGEKFADVVRDALDREVKRRRKEAAKAEERRKP